mgnify:CR=1 FL=1
MKAPSRARNLNVLVLLVALIMSTITHAEASCRIAIPEVHFQANSIEPVRGMLDLGCVLRPVHADSALSDIAMLLRDNPSITLGLVGHADAEEKDVRVLSLARARWMACMLTSNHGIEPGRLSIEGKGAEQPRFSRRELRHMTSVERVQAREHNRRVEIRVTGFAWAPAQVDEISAVRFLSDPAPATRPSENFCDRQQVEFTCGTRDGTVCEEETPSVEDPLPASGERAGIPGTTHAEKMTATEPSLLTNPIDGDRITIVGLPDGPSGGRVEILTLDGRSLCARSFAHVLAGERVAIDLPSFPAASVYILRINIGARSWSLRFVKR